MADFEKIEFLLLQAVQLIVVLFPAIKMGQIQEFIDVGEYGLALEDIIYVLNEQTEPVPQNIVALIAQVSTEMKMDPILMGGQLKNAFKE